MFGRLVRCLITTLALAPLLSAVPAGAQQAGPGHQPAKDAKPAPPAGKPAAPKPPPKPPAKPPLVQPKPGAAAQRAHPPAKPGAKPAPKPAAKPAPAVVPVPAPAPEPDKPAEPTKGASGAPLPRFASLRSDDVNMRAGPGTRYPVEWVYKRRDLPVQIEREFEIWRLVRDQEGVRGWVHQAVLAPRRTGVVVGEERALRRDASDTAAAAARVKPGVIVRIRSCEATSDWCHVSVQDYRGWLKRSEFWGTLPGEAIQ